MAEAEGSKGAQQAIYDEESGQFICNYCGGTFQSEKAVWGHIGRAHRGQQTSTTKLRDGEDYVPMKNELDPYGFMVPSEAARPLSQMGTLRRILENNGIKTSRETIVELFERKDPRDLNALAKILGLADIGPGKRGLILEAWKAYIEQSGGGTIETTPVQDDPYDFGGKKPPRRNPLQMSPDEMVDFTPMDWAKYAMDMRKLANATKMQQMAQEQIYEQLGLGIAPMGGGGGATTAKVPPEIQAKLDRLTQLEEDERLQKRMEPFIAEMRKLQETKKGGSFGGIEDIREFALTTKLLESMGADKGAELLRTNLESKLQQQKIEADKEIKQTQMQMEQARDQNRVAEIKVMEANMKSEIQRLQTLYEVANTEKKKDLVQTINEAKAIVDTMKGITGNDAASAEKDKMDALVNIANSAMATMKPVLGEIARNWGGGGRGPGGPGPGQSAYAQQQNPQGPVMAHCTTPNCGNDFVVDPSKKQAQCPKCQTIYDIEPTPGSAPPAPPPRNLPPQPQQAQQWQQQPLPSLGGRQEMNSIQQRRQALLGMDRRELDAAAQTMGINPSLYNTSEALVEEMLAHAFPSG